MTPERHALVKKLFLDVVDHPEAEWQKVLAERCGDNPELKTEVERLLANYVDHTIEVSNEDAAAAPTVPTGSGSSPPSASHLFDAGDMVSERYRIVTLLGRGGMGDVYRAEDLVLGQTVALKFLSPLFTRDREWCRRFQNEVRSALKITHPNVCRVHDIGECNGRLFLSMEYIDGDDLKSLLKRIGRLSRDKAVDLSRQTCIGLAAAHQAGILHRDLKPANIMVDGKGTVRITDFGLASLPEDIRKDEIAAGTPAYMAPEQIHGRSVSVQSDIYSLGLVMYEMFTGRPAFDGKSVGEFRKLHESSRPKALSDVVDDIHPDVERIILQCLEKDPRNRPDSALAVAAALPGENILAMALAANVMPSPTMVEAARPQATRLVAPALLAAIPLLLLLVVFGLRTLRPQAWEARLDKPPEVLAEQASQFMTSLGVPGESAAFGFCGWREAQRYAIRAQAGTNETASNLDTDSPILFWYRRSPEAIVPIRAATVFLGASRPKLNDPPWHSPGVSSLVLDPGGRVLMFKRGGDSGSASERSSDMGWPFEAMGLVDGAGRIPSFKVTDGFFDESIEEDRRVRGMMVNGEPAELAVVGSGLSHSARAVAAVDPEASFRAFVLVITLCAVPLAFRNLRAGTSDIRGAARLALALVVLQILFIPMQIRVAGRFDDLLFMLCLKFLLILGVGALVAILYVALEPIARRFWPDMLITWSRLMAGRVRDPFVARHLMVGIGVGCFWGLLVIVEPWLGAGLSVESDATTFHPSVLINVLRGRMTMAGILGSLVEAVFRGLLFVMLLALLRAGLRRPRIAAVLAAVIIALVVVPNGSNVVASILVLGVGGACVAVWLMVRYGLLSLVAALFVTYLLHRFPISYRFDLWTGDQSMAILLIIIGLLLFAYLGARREAVARMGA
ncbi:MAG: serine/threonine-protein kinase [Planctomycetota bacterium]|jgi:serine/threonine-protein kinase